MRDGFLALAQDHPDRFRVIDGNRDITTVATEILDTVTPYLPACPA